MNKKREKCVGDKVDLFKCVLCVLNAENNFCKQRGML